jgi:hypothetical protein
MNNSLFYAFRLKRKLIHQNNNKDSVWLQRKSRKIQLTKTIEFLGSDECKFSFPGANILKFLKISVSILIFLHFLNNQTDRWFRSGTKSLKKHSASERKKKKKIEIEAI